MNWGDRARDHWQRHLPKRYTALDDPERFSDGELGEGDLTVRRKLNPDEVAEIALLVAEHETARSSRGNSSTNRTRARPARSPGGLDGTVG